MISSFLFDTLHFLSSTLPMEMTYTQIDPQSSSNELGILKL